jgi:hypothetical protein
MVIMSVAINKKGIQPKKDGREREKKNKIK